VHIGYGRNIIEVSTFRKNAIIQNGFIKKDEKGKLLRDNLFGSEKDDIQRRDITINSLLYDPNKKVIIDYFNGFSDIKNKKIKVIGDPKKRFIEDPMRIIRIIRISSKLNLQIDDKLSRIMIANLDSIIDIPGSRLFDEICKMFTNGHAASCLDMLFNYDVLKILAPRLSDLMKDKKNLDKMKILLMASDQRFEKKLTISISFVLSSLFWILIKDEYKMLLKKNKLSKIRSIFIVVDNFFSNFKQINIPKRIQFEMKAIWVNQIRFENTKGKKPIKLLNSDMFKISYDFFLLRNQIDEISNNTFLWWADLYKKKP
jgi:poly(A) polymerase